jgi:hypothetical protein
VSLIISSACAATALLASVAAPASASGRASLAAVQQQLPLDALALFFALVDSALDSGSSLCSSLVRIAYGKHTQRLLHPDDRRGSAGPPLVPIQTYSAAPSTARTRANRQSTAAAQKSSGLVVPLYSRSLLECPEDAQAPDPASMLPVAASDAFQHLFELILATSGSTSEPLKAVGRRCLTAMRRSYTPLTLVSCTLRILTQSVDVRHRMASLMLLFSILTTSSSSSASMDDASNMNHQSSVLSFVSQHAVFSSILKEACSLINTHSNSKPGSPVSDHKLGPYVDQIVYTVFKFEPSNVLEAFSALSSDELSRLLPICDASMSGSIPNLAAHVTRGGAPAAAPVEKRVVPRAGLKVVDSPAQPAAARTDASSDISVSFRTERPPISSQLLTRDEDEAAPMLNPALAAFSGAPRAPAQPQPTSTQPLSAQSPAPVQPLAAQAVPLTLQNLEAVLASLLGSTAASAAPAARPEHPLPDYDRRMKALHFFGRCIDTTPPSATPAGSVLEVIQLPPLPLVHRNDAPWKHAFARIVYGITLCLPGVAPASYASLSLQQQEAMLLTTLSVIRKLFRNTVSYVAPQTGLVFQALFTCASYSEQQGYSNIVEKTCQEIASHLPIWLILFRSTACISASLPLDGPGSATAAPPEVAPHCPYYTMAFKVILGALHRITIPGSLGTHTSQGFDAAPLFPIIGYVSALFKLQKHTQDVGVQELFATATSVLQELRRTSNPLDFKSNMSRYGLQ